MAYDVRYICTQLGRRSAASFAPRTGLHACRNSGQDKIKGEEKKRVKVILEEGWTEHVASRLCVCVRKQNKTKRWGKMERREKFKYLAHPIPRTEECELIETNN